MGDLSQNKIREGEKGRDGGREKRHRTKHED